MANSKALFSKEGRERIKKGVDIVANAVKVTLGARGRCVVLRKGENEYSITKDGVSIVNAFDKLEDDVENLGLLMVKESASKSRDVSGDGTTATCILTQALIENGIKYLDEGANPVQLKNGIDYATELVVNKLTELSKPVDNIELLKQIATISANGDKEIGEMIAEAVDKVGKDGSLTIERGQTNETTVEYTSGYNYKSGWSSPFYIMPHENGKFEFENPYILIYHGKISDSKQVLPILEQVLKNTKTHDKKPSIVIIAEEIEGEALKWLTLNRGLGNINVVSVRANGYLDTKTRILEDLAILVGAKLISEKEKGQLLKDTKFEDLGTCDKIVMDEHSTLIMGVHGNKEQIEARKEFIKEFIKNETSDFHLGIAKERLAKLSGGVAVIKVGGKTEAEINEKADRIDDAKCSCISASEGYVVGGGKALLECLTALDIKTLSDNKDFTNGIDVVRKSIQYPFWQILTNSGETKEIPLIQNLEPNFGYNAVSGEFENLVESGIIDATKVVKTALQNASSTASLYLITESVVY